MDHLKQKFYKYFLYPASKLYWKLLHPTAKGARALILFQEEILLVKNLNVTYWTMPGGGIDKGETPEACIVRELNEELDLSGLTIECLLGTYHTKNEGKDGGIYIFVVRPQTKAFKRHWEIADAEWFRLDALPEHMSPATLRRIAEYKAGEREVETSW